MYSKQITNYSLERYASRFSILPSDTPSLWQSKLLLKPRGVLIYLSWFVLITNFRSSGSLLNSTMLTPHLNVRSKWFDVVESDNFPCLKSHIGGCACCDWLDQLEVQSHLKYVKTDQFSNAVKVLGPNQWLHWTFRMRLR